MPAPDIQAGHPASATLNGWSTTKSFRRVTAGQWGRLAALDATERLVILKVNRIDSAHAGRGALFVPDMIGDELEYSPLPAEIPALQASPKFILVSRRVQAFGAYEYGRLIRWGPTSTGKADTPTDEGLFFTNWKSRTAVSTDDPSWILDWYVNFIALKGVAFHEYALPGRPASHGCVRLLEGDAAWLYGWAEQWVPGRGSRVRQYGTPVLVAGNYDYAAPAPWQRLAEDPRADRVSLAEIETALAPHLATLAARRTSPAPALATRGTAAQAI
jgi:hypothetical protein